MLITSQLSADNQFLKMLVCSGGGSGEVMVVNEIYIVW